jgi:hypothetical protein
MAADEFDARKWIDQAIADSAAGGADEGGAA